MDSLRGVGDNDNNYDDENYDNPIILYMNDGKLMKGNIINIPTVLSALHDLQAAVPRPLILAHAKHP